MSMDGSEIYYGSASDNSAWRERSNRSMSSAACNSCPHAVHRRSAYVDNARLLEGVPVVVLDGLIVRVRVRLAVGAPSAVAVRAGNIHWSAPQRAGAVIKFTCPLLN